MNLYDILLARCICGNKSEECIVATPLEVTENGEYEAEEGYAYNPVTVNVSGGGGDFSTAEVTFVNTEEGKEYTAHPLVLSNGVIKIDSFAVATSVTVTVPLGENGTVLGLDVIDPDSVSGAPTASGDIQFDLMAGGYVVTGDGTITAAGSRGGI